MTNLKIFGQTFNNVTGIKATNSSDAIVTFSEGSGGGLTTIASGSFVGTGAYDLPVAIGNKMAKTDFWFKFNARANSEFPYDTNYKYGYGMVIISSDFGHFDLSTEGDSKQIISDKTIKINNSGTVTEATAGMFIGDIEQVRNGTANNISRPNNFRINRKSTGFELRYYNSNSSHQYTTGITYDYEVVYFGSNPSTDIVEVS